MAEYFKPVYSDELLHYQVKGAKWGVRRWQNLDGSLTPEGRIHYGIGPARGTRPDYTNEAIDDFEGMMDLDARRKNTLNAVRKQSKPAYWTQRRVFESKAHHEERVAKYNSERDALLQKHFDQTVEYETKREELREKYAKYADLADEIMEYVADTETPNRSEQSAKDADELTKLWKEIDWAVNLYANSSFLSKEALNSYRKIQTPKDGGKKLVDKLEAAYTSGGDKPPSFSSVKEVRDVDVSELVKVVNDMDRIEKAKGKSKYRDEEYNRLNGVGFDISQSMARKLTGEYGTRSIDDYDTYASDALAQYFEEKARYLAKQERGDSDNEYYWYFNPEEEERHKKS